MSPEPDYTKIRELRYMPIGAMILLVFSGLSFLLLAWAVIQHTLFTPNRPLHAPWILPVMVSVNSLAFALGIYLFARRRVGIRLKPDGFDLPVFDVSLSWSDIAALDVVRIGDASAGEAAIELLLVELTEVGRKKIGQRKLANHPYARQLDPTPDVALWINFFSYGPGIKTGSDFANDLRKRIAAAPSPE